MVHVLAEPLRSRSRQTLFLLHATTQNGVLTDKSLENWMKKTLFDPVTSSIQRIVDQFRFAERVTSQEEQDSVYDRVERDVMDLLDDHRWVKLRRPLRWERNSIARSASSQFQP